MTRTMWCLLAVSLATACSRTITPLDGGAVDSALVDSALDVLSDGGPHPDGSFADATDAHDVAEEADSRIDAARVDVTTADAADETPDVPIDAFLCAMPDRDGDGHDSTACGGDDCDDTDSSRFPGSLEVCNGADDDCNGAIDDGPAPNNACMTAGLPNASSVACVGGVCTAAVCVAPYLDCTSSAGCETDGSTTANCGSCGNACEVAAGAECVAATCRNHAWAGWPMPNPVSTGLPNPANYDTSTAGVVVDRVTGLEWQADGAIGSMMTQSEAIAFCEGLNLNGHTDWRLPSVIELVSIVDRTRFNPSINVSAFPITSLGEYWTSSAHLGLPDRGWYVGFDSGIVWTTPSSTLSHARCVR